MPRKDRQYCLLGERSVNDQIQVKHDQDAGCTWPCTFDASYLYSVVHSTGLKQSLGDRCTRHARPSACDTAFWFCLHRRYNVYDADTFAPARFFSLFKSAPTASSSTGAAAAARRRLLQSGGGSSSSSVAGPGQPGRWRLADDEGGLDAVLLVYDLLEELLSMQVGND